MIDVILQITPGMVVGSFWETFLASWIYALVASVVTWMFSVNSRDYLLVHAARMSMRTMPSEKFDEPGVLFIQLDGVPAARPALARAGGQRADDQPVASDWHPPTGRLGGGAAVDDAGQPGGNPARQQRRHPGLSVVREGDGSSWSWPTIPRTPP